MPSLSVVDYGFLLAESQASPRHVSALHLFECPAGAPPDFVGRLLEGFRELNPIQPYNWKFHTSAFSFPSWVNDADFDIDNHIFHEALPKPGTMDQLIDHLEKLHEPLLDRDKPLWESYVIEGIRGGRFAIFTKIHHAYTDGISFTRRMINSLAKTPEDMSVNPEWANDIDLHHHSEKRKTVVETVLGAARSVGRQALVVPQLTELILKHGMRLISGGGGDLPVPFSAPKTLFNKPLTAKRSIGLCSLELSRVKAVARHQHVTINDVILTVCDIAMRRYLDDHDDHVDSPLVAQMPMSLRRDGDTSTHGNQVTIALLEMASDHSDPLERLKEIHQHARNVKYEFTSMTAEATEVYSLFTQIAAQLGDLTHLSEKMQPLGNVVISNVVGQTQPLYLKGARLLATYPISTIAPNTAINITIFTHEGQMRFGLVTGTVAIPDPQAIAGSIVDALHGLESAIQGAGLSSAKGASEVRKKRVAPNKTVSQKTTSKKVSRKVSKKGAHAK